jgi:hypothetical protein
MSLGMGVSVIVGARSVSMVEVGSKVAGIVEVGEGITVTKRFSSFSPFPCPPHAETNAHMTQTKTITLLIALLQRSITSPLQFHYTRLSLQNISPHGTPIKSDAHWNILELFLDGLSPFEHPLAVLLKPPSPAARTLPEAYFPKQGRVW